MTRLDQIKTYKVFPAQLDGHTLVVSPRGDAVGFRDTEVAGELRTLLDLAGTPGVVNLIVDLAGSEYFGSTMIGAINHLGTQFRQKGGRIALCHASAQMLEMLAVMHLNELWINFDTRKIAVKAMSKV